MAKDTAVYGLSSIIGRFLNWLLVPLYTNVFASSEYGVVTYLYAIVAIALIVLTYGMETGFFRFSNHERYTDPAEVYSTSLMSLIGSSTVFAVLLLVFIDPVSRALGCADHSSYVWLLGLAVALDTATAIPFSYLRYAHRPMRFATLKLVNIGINIGLNIFFILICPWVWEQAPGTIAWFYDPTYGIGYIFLANFISSLATALLLLPECRGIKWRFNARLWREMLAYSFPLLILGIAGIMNQTLDKILFPVLVSDKAAADSMLGIYGANQKIAIVMVMFTQAFRFAYEPFIFAKNKEAGGNKLQAYSDAMKYFVIFAMVIFLGVTFFIDILRYFISPSYWSGLKVVPVVMIAEFFFGVFFNLSLWYKLTDRTIWGTWFSLGGLAVTVVMNILLVPTMGYMGCAWAAFSCYGAMMVASYFVGQAKFPISYHTRRLLFYFVTAMALWGLSVVVATPYALLNMAIRVVILAFYIAMAARIEHFSLSDIVKIIKKK